MGSAASIGEGTQEFGNEITELYSLINQQFDKIALYDSKIILDEDKKLFKDHKLLIKILTSSTKYQLLKLDKTITSEFLNKLVGGSSYGIFLSSLLKSSSELDTEYLNKAMNGMGCGDESILNNILCSKNSNDLKILCEYYKINCNIDLSEKIQKKTIKESPTQMFLARILKCDRDESTIECNEDTANLLAVKINKLIKEKKVSNESLTEFIEILATTSRVTCSEMNDKFKDMFNETLESIIIKKFSKNFGRSILLWVSLLDVSVANVIIDTGNKSNGDLVYVLARYDKLFLEKVNNQMKSIFDKTLNEFISNKCSGHFKDVCLSWAQSCSCLTDKGSMLLLDEYLSNERILYGNDVVNTNLNDASSECFITTMKHLNSVTSILHNALGKNDVIVSKTLSKKNIKKNKIKSENIEEQCKINEDYDTKQKAVLDYISLHFELADKDGSGVLEANEFWTMFKGLHLDLMGFTVEEIDAMKDFCDWDNDGCISYEEVSGEIADAIINAIENNINNGLTVSENIEKLTEMENQILNENIIEENGIEDETNNPPSDVETMLPPDLLQYIHDSFDTYDINKNGSLDRTEFWQLINSMNLGLTDGDFDSLREQWDNSGDGEIDWKESAVQFNKLLLNLASDHRDHWIGLIDKESQKLFWYNLRDQSSQWMSEADQVYYCAHAEKSVDVDYDDYEIKMKKIKIESDLAKKGLDDALINKKKAEAINLNERLKKRKQNKQ